MANQEKYYIARLVKARSFSGAQDLHHSAGQSLKVGYEEKIKC